MTQPNPTTQPSQADREYSRGFGAGLDHIANFINALDSAEMTTQEVRSAIYSECLTARPSIREHRPEAHRAAFSAQPSQAALEHAVRWATEIGKYGGVILDRGQVEGLAMAFDRFERDTEKRVRESLAGPWCRTCGKSWPKDENCDVCQQWWRENSPPAGEANVERVARAIALEFDIDPDVFIGMHGKEKWVNEWHKIARAALAALERTTDAGE